MSVTPTYDLSKRLDETRNLVAASAEFRTWTSTGSAAAAKAKTFLSRYAMTSVPAAIVRLGERQARRDTSNRTLFDFDRYEIAVIFIGPAPTASVEDDNDEITAFLDIIQKIESEMLTAFAASVSSYPDFTSFEGPMIGEPNPANTPDGERHYEAVYIWNVDGHT